MAKDEPTHKSVTNQTGSTSAAMTGYPPGSWSIVNSVGPDNSRGLYILGNDGDVCDLYAERKDEHGIARGLVPFANAESNARLIAAAPDLLEACKLLHKALLRGPQIIRNDEIAQIQNAIQKATVGG